VDVVLNIRLTMLFLLLLVVSERQYTHTTFFLACRLSEPSSMSTEAVILSLVKIIFKPALSKNKKTPQRLYWNIFFERLYWNLSSSP